jgi:hypothetical protein
VADAGTAQAVDEAVVVQLDGSRSSDADGDSLTYTWRQTAGPTVPLSNGGSARPTFVAPANISTNEELLFELVTNDGRLDSAPSSVALTIRAAAPWKDDRFVSITSAALAEGQFTFNNPWTQADLTYENIDATIGYDSVKNAHPAGRVDSFTTLMTQYRERRAQCERDYTTFFARGSFTSFLYENDPYYFRDRRCYPTLQTAANLEQTTTGDPFAAQVLQRYGYYCGGGYPPYGAFGAGSPEPLDGVDYCCRLHDEQIWEGRGDYSNECGIAMCLRQATAMPAGVWNALTSVEEARTHWYGSGAFGGASYACPGNQTNTLPPPALGP